MTRLAVGCPPALDDVAAGLWEEYEHVWLVAAHARCVDGSGLEPVMSPTDVPHYVCDTGRHDWPADAVDTAAWGTLLGAGLATCLDRPAVLITDPTDRRRIVTCLGARWHVVPSGYPNMSPPVRLILPVL